MEKLSSSYLEYKNNLVKEQVGGGRHDKLNNAFRIWIVGDGYGGPGGRSSDFKHIPVRVTKIQREGANLNQAGSTVDKFTIPDEWNSEVERGLNRMDKN